MPNMGVGFASYTTFKKQNRFVLHIPNVTHVGNSSTRVYNKVLIEEKAARPSMSFKEFDVPHLMETVFYAGKPEWKPIQVTLYDVAATNPALNWVNSIYSVQRNAFRGQAGASYFGAIANNFKRDIQIFMLDGCGFALEAWNYVNAYPTSVDFGGTDMSSDQPVRVVMDIRYDRAYWEPCSRKLINLASSYMMP